MTKKDRPPVAGWLDACLQQQHAAVALPAVTLNRKLTASSLEKPAFNLNVYQQAEAYLDGLFADYGAAKATLGAENFKESNVLVVYMCYKRANLIRSTLTSLLMSQGLEEYDLMISQDGLGGPGTPYVLDVEVQETVNALYVHHEVNLCTGLHHYFVKRFAFDIMGYEYLLVVEEDNALHYQALQKRLRYLAHLICTQFLKSVLDLSLEEKEIGLVSLTELDNSLLVDESRYNSAVLRAAVEDGHLWVFGVHKSRYDAVSKHLYDYYKVIKGHDYSLAHAPPLHDTIRALHKEKGFPEGIPLSQDAFFVHSLLKEGYSRRYLSLVRLTQPMGWMGLHFKQDPAQFYMKYGQGMYEGTIAAKAFEVAKNPEELEELKKDAAARLDVIYQQYLGRAVELPTSDSVVLRLVVGRMNGVELVRDILNSAEHRRQMKVMVGTRGAPKR
ncbi:hypothetical protein VOLCADRAFT_91295 [Volvox carteri f. nagariensis]|uniref:Uncharacterized protein n=1 Tax=Volvox carteri f. nagariensis TaxID=3068 RepID=D8TWP0_VOLCA|nr:uncharacterized protein VOLCADRAFT_91295 [Volvox carteri f. nagariensis]EFJ48181.1 hypothetical protein VOLCADRAFT_91295 [Volvox carteri f. nagariensis]|eukprot:XP_002950866.1 hypothetical protein VOLCADRAFT_91295 [Volvox carteri f. nagariensis]